MCQALRQELHSAHVHHDADLTGLLRAWNAGDDDALEALSALVHQELRDIARRLLANEHRDHRWRPTELVQESYLRLLDWRSVHWENRAHFFATAARMMRRVLVDAARHRRALKRGHEFEILPLDDGTCAVSGERHDLVALEDALTELEVVNARASRVIELRFFGGFTVEETAEALAVSVRTVINDWNAARLWLLRRLTKDT
jgi:RNA polymerase sigma factor (TIGR02999 family)